MNTFYNDFRECLHYSVQAAWSRYLQRSMVRGEVRLQERKGANATTRFLPCVASWAMQETDQLGQVKVEIPAVTHVLGAEKKKKDSGLSAYLS